MINLDIPCKLAKTKYRPHNGPVRRARTILEKKLGRAIRVGYLACHACHNGMCIEPLHIYEGTRSQNMADRTDSGYTSYQEEKTHCLKGHEYTKENTYYWRTHRICRACDRARKQLIRK